MVSIAAKRASGLQVATIISVRFQDRDSELTMMMIWTLLMKMVKSLLVGSNSNSLPTRATRSQVISCKTADRSFLEPVVVPIQPVDFKRSEVPRTRLQPARSTRR